LKSPLKGLGGAEWFRTWIDLLSDQALLASQLSLLPEFSPPAPHQVQRLRDLPRDPTYNLWCFEPTAGAGTSSPKEKPDRPNASERLRDILDSAVFEAAEPDEETPFEQEIEKYVREYGGAALAAIYRVIFESDRALDVGPALLQALALLPRRVEHLGRASIFRASLLHAHPAIRFVAARALLRLRGPLTVEALRASAECEAHPELRRDLAEILRLLDGSGEPATA
jgi:hypothetical protein